MGLEGYRNFGVLRLIQKLDKTNLQKVMRRDLKKLRVGYKKGILRRKLLLLTGFDLEKLLKSLDVHLSENLSKETLFLFIHLEDKVDLNGTVLISRLFSCWALSRLRHLVSFKPNRFRILLLFSLSVHLCKGSSLKIIQTMFIFLLSCSSPFYF